MDKETWKDCLERIEPRPEDAITVLELCGPKRVANAPEDTEEAAKKWMQELLKKERGAEAIAKAIISVWFGVTISRKSKKAELAEA